MKGAAVAPQDTDALTAEAVLILDEQRLRAMLAADVATLEALLAPGLSYTHSDGRTDTREGYLASLASGALNYRRCERETVATTLRGPVAMLEGRLRLHALDQGQEKAIRIHYLANWVLDAGHGWRLLAWASTLVEKIQPEQAPA
jgi:hypothetical protein